MLRKGGKYVTIVSYGLFGYTSRYTTKHLSQVTTNYFKLKPVMFIDREIFKLNRCKLNDSLSYLFQCSAVRQKFQADQRIFLNVKGHRFRYQFNVKDGIFSNKPLFERTVGITRTIQ